MREAGDGMIRDDCACPGCSPHSYSVYGEDSCPVCGAPVYIRGQTADGRLIGSCGDAFTVARWWDDYDQVEA